MLQSISCCVLTNFTFFLIGLNRFLHATLSAITNRTFKLSVTAIVIATTYDVRIIFVVIINYGVIFLFPSGISSDKVKSPSLLIGLYIFYQRRNAEQACL